MADDDANDANKRIELVTETSDAARQLLVGWALLAALLIGSPALADAVYGRGPIENALGRFILVVVACLTAANFLANMLERAPAPTADEAADSEAVDGSDREVGPTGIADS